LKIIFSIFHEEMIIRYDNFFTEVRGVLYYVDRRSSNVCIKEKKSLILEFCWQNQKMSFDGFSDVEIQKITTMKARKPEVKLAKNIPCHKKVRQFDAQNDENHNRNDDDSFKVQEPPTQSEIKLSTVDEDLEKNCSKNSNGNRHLRWQEEQISRLRASAEADGGTE